ncbi:nicotinamide riboside transporter PnuC [Massilia aerilata]|uniref:Nicotinamide riboside transporter PnuC n=1 Tax=Massilia aerilata TaxID=453817 RepID=A0ABW0RRA0_9BURK
MDQAGQGLASMYAALAATAPLELAANVFTAAAIVLAGRNNVHTWWTGIAGTALFGLLFAQNRLYADVALQVFFVVTGIVGWWKWLRGRHGEPLPVTHAGAGSLLWILPLGLGATAAYGAMLHHFTNAYAPFIDSAVLVFSIIGQLLMMQRRVENWGFWLLVNTIATPLYFSRGLHLTAVLYAGFWINALVSWRNWHKLAAPPSLENIRP